MMATRLLRISPELAIPSEVVTATSVVYGGKGMGKTNLASVLIEEATKAHLRWAALDPMGVLWGLRHSKDGTGPGVECVILGGPHGDIPIEPTSGEIVADLVIDEGVNTVIDFSRKPSGEMWGKNEKIRFVTDYALRLFRRQGELLPGNQRREPLLQILDEAARYIPQIIPAQAVDLAKCVGAWEQAAEEGRNIGLGVAFLTQRSARMNKSVSELADVMFAFRTIGPNSLAAVMDWLGEHIDKSRIRDVAAQVRELEVGQCLVVSPGWLRVEKIVKIRERETFDSSATPKPGQRAHKVTGKAAKPDLAKYQERMAATIEKAEADDPKKLRKLLAERDSRIRQLEKAPPAKTTGKAAPDQHAVDRAVAAAQREHTGAITKLRKALEAAMKFIVNVSTQDFNVAGVDKEELQRAVEAAVGKATQIVDQRFAARQRQIDQLRLAAQRIAATLKSVLNDEDVVIEVQVARNEPFTVSAPPRRQPAARPVREPRDPSLNGALGKGERTVLIAIVQYPEGAERDQLTVLTGYKRSTRDTYIQRLSLAGHVAIEGGRVVATDAGVDALGSDFEPLPQGEELQSYWLDRLPEGERAILEPLIAQYPATVDRDTLSEITGYKRSTRDTYLQRLGSRRLVENIGRGEVRASSSLFSETFA